MSPIPLPVSSYRSTSTARSNVIRHVKRARSGTDAPVIVLATVCIILLFLILFLIARRFYRTRRFSSRSSPKPDRRSTFWRFFPRKLRFLWTSNRTRRTATVSHPDPLPAIPLKAPARPWLVYHPARPRMCHPPHAHLRRSPRVCENRIGDHKVYRRGGPNPRWRSDSNTYLLGDLPPHRQPRPSRPQVRPRVSGKYIRPFLEISVTRGVGGNDVRTPRSPESKNTPSTPALAREGSIGTSQETQIGHEVDSECDAAGDTAPESLSRINTPRTGTDGARLVDSEVSV
ncbi:hypothetical protein EDD17DRAFT_1012711 [Pisolithus thermaeus]|nr:hypothetical protein EDD17DRAFT_1012711 [Pisolithus thermaeus]